MVIATEGITGDFFDAFLASLVRSVVSHMNTDRSLKMKHDFSTQKQIYLLKEET